MFAGINTSLSKMSLTLSSEVFNLDSFGKVSFPKEILNLRHFVATANVVLLQ